MEISYGSVACFPSDSGQWTIPAGPADYVKYAGCPSWRVLVARMNQAQTSMGDNDYFFVSGTYLNSTAPAISSPP